MEKLLVIGGSGFIGKNLIRLLSDKYEITSVAKNSEVYGINNLKIDLNNTDFGFINGFSKIIYLGTVSSPKEAEVKPNDAFISNVVNIHNFLEAARNQKTDKIILLSSAVLYSPENKTPLIEESETAPFLSIYNFSKYNLEILAKFYAKKYSLPITVFRLSNTYGPGQTSERAPYLIPGLFEQAIKKGLMEIWNTSPVRDFVYVNDVSKVLSLELETPGGGLFNLATGIGKSVKQVAETVKKITGADYVDLGKEVSPPNKVVCNMDSLNKRLKYIPDTTLEKGLEASYDYYLDLYKKNV
jgi:dTDP-glucose 4,6-dehydratase